MAKFSFQYIYIYIYWPNRPKSFRTKAYKLGHSSPRVLLNWAWTGNNFGGQNRNCTYWLFFIFLTGMNRFSSGWGIYSPLMSSNLDLGSVNLRSIYYIAYSLRLGPWYASTEFEIKLRPSSIFQVKLFQSAQEHGGFFCPKH